MPIVCPVCEHQQAAGFECEVCGKELVPPAARPQAPMAVQRVEGLETRPERVGEVPVAPMPELAVSRYRNVEVQVEAVPDVEQTRQAAVGNVAVERLGELTEDRAAPVGAPTPVSAGPVTCRYCRNVQASGVICDRCGMRLPVFAAPVVAGVAVSGGVREQVRCRACGAPAYTGERCTDCGHEIPWPEE